MSLRTFFLGDTLDTGDQTLEPVDYIIIGGQSNMDGRTPISEIPLGYDDAFPNVKLWKSANTLADWNVNELYPFAKGRPSNYAWDTILLKDLADNLGKTLKVVSWSMGGTSIGKVGGDGNLDNSGSWNIAVTDSHLDVLKTRILDIIKYEKNVNNKRANFRMMLWDQKESDAYIESYSTSYVYDDNGVLKGNFVDMVNFMRTFVGNENMPIVFAQHMITQTALYNENVIAAQELFDDNDANSYLLRMNDNTERYPLQDDNAHYTSIGVQNVASDMYDIIMNNNLLNNWK